MAVFRHATIYYDDSRSMSAQRGAKMFTREQEDLEDDK
jgi:hypothetical protein